MRLGICALFLSTATMAFCQSATLAPSTPDKTDKPPLLFNWSAKDSSKTPPVWQSNSLASQPIVLQRNSALNSAQIDPKMIVQPPKPSLGVQAQGTPILKNQFPGLRFQPIQTATAKLEPAPTPWPHLKVQKIPIVWPNYKLIAIDSKTPMPATAPDKSNH